MNKIIPFTRTGQLFLPLDNTLSFDFSPECYATLQLLHSLDFSQFEKNQSNMGRPNAASPRQMMELIIYGKLLGYNSCREFLRLSTDICARWILDGKKVPSYSTFARFIDQNQDAIQSLFYQMNGKLQSMGELKGETIYQDGTKIESASNKYTFVWRKGIQKYMPKAFVHLQTLYKDFVEYFPASSFVEVLTEENALPVMMEIRRFLRKEIPGIDHARHGRGIRSNPIEKLFRDIEKYLESWIKYIMYNEMFENNNPTNRNSFSKTDTDATFMHTKEDYMGNGQLKPCYNIQNLVDSNYIVSTYCSADRTDYHTAVPALKKMQENLSIHYTNYCADSGYDCKENYEYLEKKGIKSFIKPQMYQENKKRKNRNDPSRRSNMKYRENFDAYECTMGRLLIRRKDLEKQGRESSLKRGYKPKPNQRIYQSFIGCLDCPVRQQCMKSTAKKFDYKKLKVDTQLDMYRSNTLRNIESIQGKIIRVNRSIQAEGSFALIKDALSMRRFSRRGYKAVETEWILCCMTANTLRYMKRLAQGLVGSPFEYKIDIGQEEIPRAI